MTAREAREISLRSYESTQTKDILESIKKEALKGERRLLLYNVVDDRAIKELIKLSYNVTADYDKDGYLCIISW